jgi:hypothetical protein
MCLFSHLPIGFGLLCLATLGPVSGATIEFLDQAGDNVSFSNIIEVNGSADPSFSLFGGVSTMHDTLDLDAFNLRVEPVSGFEFENGRLSLSAISDSGSLIESIKISQSGLATTLGEASANVDLGGSVTVDGVRSATASTSFSKDSSAGDSFDSEFWERELIFSFAPTDEVRLDINHSIFASVASGALGTLEANGLLIQVNTTTATALPEPSSWLALGGIGGTLTLRRFRRRT